MTEVILKTSIMPINVKELDSLLKKISSDSITKQNLVPGSVQEALLKQNDSRRLKTKERVKVH